MLADAAKHPALLSNVARYVDLSLDSPTPAGWVKLTDGSGVPYYHEPDTGVRCVTRCTGGPMPLAGTW